MTAQELLALSERCEKATGPDRELDALIAVALKLGARGLTDDDHEYLTPLRKDDGERAGGYWFHCRSGKSLRTAPAYTASLDAAMSLVPEGWSWGVTAETERSISGSSPFSACVRRYWSSFYRDHFCRAATPALALCAAALRARAAQVGEA